MSRPELLDDRFEDLVRELRSGRVAAPPELRERVRAIAAPVPEPRPSLFERVRLRRAALVLVPVSLAAVVSAAMVQGLVSSGERDAASSRTKRVLVGGSLEALEGKAPPSTARDQDAASLPPGRRLVDYRIRMRLRVGNLEDLSRATVRTKRTVRRLGGYVG
ncbi:MAG: hypothetical protein ABR521_02345, partial [Gaiellaceae bacterium]